MKKTFAAHLKVTKRQVPVTIMQEQDVFSREMPVEDVPPGKFFRWAGSTFRAVGRHHQMTVTNGAIFAFHEEEQRLFSLTPTTIVTAICGTVETGN